MLIEVGGVLTDVVTVLADLSDVLTELADVLVVLNTVQKNIEMKGENLVKEIKILKT